MREEELHACYITPNRHHFHEKHNKNVEGELLNDRCHIKIIMHDFFML